MCPEKVAGGGGEIWGIVRARTRGDIGGGEDGVIKCNGAYPGAAARIYIYMYIRMYTCELVCARWKETEKEKRREKRHHIAGKTHKNI